MRPARYVLDTSLLLGGKEPPTDGTWSTTPEAAAEISPGGRDARRYDGWLARGLRIESAPARDLETVEAAARSAGNWDRLSPADRSLLALALGGGTLLSDDHTMLDLALRLGVTAHPVNSAGIAGTLDFKPRCTGCGRWFEAAPKANECPVCGSPVKARPVQPTRPVQR